MFENLPDDLSDGLDLADVIQGGAIRPDQIRLSLLEGAAWPVLVALVNSGEASGALLATQSPAGGLHSPRSSKWR